MKETIGIIVGGVACVMFVGFWLLVGYFALTTINVTSRWADTMIYVFITDMALAGIAAALLWEDA